MAGADAPKTTFVSEEMVKSDRPELGAAKIVVSGGRGTGGNFEPVEALADARAHARTIREVAERHEAYEHDRDRGAEGEPDIEAMTRFAIESLSNSEDGYVLLVEGARIDHANHYGNAYRALDETVALSEAVQAALDAVERADPRQRLLDALEGGQRHAELLDVELPGALGLQDPAIDLRDGRGRIGELVGHGRGEVAELAQDLAHVTGAAAGLGRAEAIALAQSLDHDPRAYVVAVMFSASVAFATPIGSWMVLTGVDVLAPVDHAATELDCLGSYASVPPVAEGPLGDVEVFGRFRDGHQVKRLNSRVLHVVSPERFVNRLSVQPISG